MVTLKNSVFKKLGVAGGTDYTGVITEDNLIITAHSYQTKLDTKFIVSLSVPLRFAGSYYERNSNQIYSRGAEILLKN